MSRRSPSRTRSRATNPELLDALVTHDPDGNHEWARPVDRHPPEVHELADYGLIGLEDPGAATRPGVRDDGIGVDLSLTGASSRAR